jgi:heptaprenyl diphosphate synthase
LPGVKPGLANIVTLIVLARYGWVAAAWVSGLRVFAGSLLLGHFLSPGFFMSLSGALFSLLVLALAMRLPRPLLRPGQLEHRGGLRAYRRAVAAGARCG